MQEMIISITNGTSNKMISPEELPSFEILGWYKGKTFFNKKEPWNKGKTGVQVSHIKNKICINNGFKNTYIPIEMYEYYHVQGWDMGMKPRNIK